MRVHYPAIKPYATHRVEVEAPHRLYLEECGNPDGVPVVFLHGGPGAGCREQDRCFFDPQRYRIVLFDQRGCGRSTPHASLEKNDTARLLADIETVRRQLGIDRWVVFGGSWGATLALLYAQAYPERVQALILRGIFLCRQGDIDWFYRQGAHRIFPDYWRDFIEPVSRHRRDDLLTAYHQLLTGDNELERMAAAKAWSIWEGRCATLDPRPAVVNHFGNPHFATALARIEAHYFVNGAFIEPDQIIGNAGQLRGIPGVIVHGRYDMVCPVEQAFALAEAWPEAQLEIVRDAGHASGEPGTVHALVSATDAMADRLESE
jgi:proline iminopeptidase